MSKSIVITFGIIILLLSYLFGYKQYFSKQAFSVHNWRQSDCVSMTQNFYMEKMPLWEPKIHAQIAQEGRGVAELPIFYYLSSKLWMLFGKHVFWNRMLNVAFVFLGLLYLFKLAFRIFNQQMVSIFVPVLFFTSPLVAYYTNNFMSNMPAIAAVFIGWYFLYDYYNSANKWALIYAFFALTLATLLRSTMIIGFGAIYVVFVLELFNIKRFGNNKSFYFRNKVLAFVLLFTSMILIVGWYVYVKHYNALNQCSYFLTTIRPIWESDKVYFVLSNLFWEHLYHLHSMVILLLFAVMFVYNLFYWKRRKSIVNIGFISSFIGVLAYFLLWFNNFYEHDYYLLDVWLFLVPNLLLFIYEFIKSDFFIRYQKTMHNTLIIVMVLCVARTTLYQSIKLNYNGPLKSFYFFLPQKFVEFIAWHHWYYDSRFFPFSDITPYLRSLGIQREDKVFSLPDKSPNITLTLMDQKGLSYFVCDPNKAIDISLQEWIENGKSQYLMISDEEWVNKPELQKFLIHKIGQWKNIHIYKL
jgi:hypothetical protein